jgi:N-acetylglutamate synthase-like GNAT family acetyltransferase
MTNPRATGISGITGKTVYIRHATEWDMVMIREDLKLHQREEPDLSQSEIVVAAEENHIIGFGIMKKGPDADAGCITISEDNRRRGIGASIVRHLMEYAPMKTVYVAEGKIGYFTKLGFTQAAKTRKTQAAGSVCRSVGGRTPIAVLKRNGSSAQARAVRH